MNHYVTGAQVGTLAVTGADGIASVDLSDYMIVGRGWTQEYTDKSQRLDGYGTVTFGQPYSGDTIRAWLLIELWLDTYQYQYVYVDGAQLMAQFITVSGRSEKDRYWIPLTAAEGATSATFPIWIESVISKVHGKWQVSLVCDGLTGGASVSVGELMLVTDGDQASGVHVNRLPPTSLSGYNSFGNDGDQWIVY